MMTMNEARREGYDDGMNDRAYSPLSFTFEHAQLNAYKGAYREGKRDAETLEFESARKERVDLNDQALFNRALDCMADVSSFEKAAIQGQQSPFPNQTYSPKDVRKQIALDLEEVARRVRADKSELCPTHLNYEEI